MDAGFAVELLQTMVFQAVALTAPLLLVGMIIGLGVSLFQAVTSIHEQTLTFVPKALGVIGGIIIMPMLISTVATTRSIRMNGTNSRNPIWNAARNSLTMNPGITTRNGN